MKPYQTQFLKYCMERSLKVWLYLEFSHIHNIGVHS